MAAARSVVPRLGPRADARARTAPPGCSRAFATWRVAVACARRGVRWCRRPSAADVRPRGHARLQRLAAAERRGRVYRRLRLGRVPRKRRCASIRRHGRDRRRRTVVELAGPGRANFGGALPALAVLGACLCWGHRQQPDTQGIAGRRRLDRVGQGALSPGRRTSCSLCCSAPRGRRGPRSAARSPWAWPLMA